MPHFPSLRLLTRNKIILSVPIVVIVTPRLSNKQRRRSNHHLQPLKLEQISTPSLADAHQLTHLVDARTECETAVLVHVLQLALVIDIERDGAMGVQVDGDGEEGMTDCGDHSWRVGGGTGREGSPTKVEIGNSGAVDALGYVGEGVVQPTNVESAGRFVLGKAAVVCQGMIVVVNDAGGRSLLCFSEVGKMHALGGSGGNCAWYLSGRL